MSIAPQVWPSMLITTLPLVGPACSVVGGLGSINSETIVMGKVRPLLIEVQNTPPLKLFKMPWFVPAYSVVGVVGSIARAPTCGGRNKPMELQFPPPSVLLNAPLLLEAA